MVTVFSPSHEYWITHNARGKLNVNKNHYQRCRDSRRKVKYYHHLPSQNKCLCRFAHETYIGIVCFVIVAIQFYWVTPMFVKMDIKL